jgi:hypothetical protein
MLYGGGGRPFSSPLKKYILFNQCVFRPGNITQSIFSGKNLKKFEILFFFFNFYGTRFLKEEKT